VREPPGTSRSVPVRPRGVPPPARCPPARCPVTITSLQRLSRGRQHFVVGIVNRGFDLIDQPFPLASPTPLGDLCCFMLPFP
jgi:hypothetical protein